MTLMVLFRATYARRAYPTIRLQMTGEARVTSAVTTYTVLNTANQQGLVEEVMRYRGSP